MKEPGAAERLCLRQSVQRRIEDVIAHIPPGGIGNAYRDTRLAQRLLQCREGKRCTIFHGAFLHDHLRDAKVGIRIGRRGIVQVHREAFDPVDALAHRHT